MVIVARGVGKAATATVAMGVAAIVIHDHTIDHTREMRMPTKVTTSIGEMEVAHIGPHGTEEDKTHGAMAPPLLKHVIVIGS